MTSFNEPERNLAQEARFEQQRQEQITATRSRSRGRYGDRCCPDCGHPWEYHHPDREERCPTNSEVAGIVMNGRRDHYPTPPHAVAAIVPDLHSPAPIKMIHHLTNEVHPGGRASDEYVRYRLDDARYPQPTALRTTDTWKRISEGIPGNARVKGMILVKRYDSVKDKWKIALAYANVSGGWSTGYGQIEDFGFWAEIPE